MHVHAGLLEVAFSQDKVQLWRQVQLYKSVYLVLSSWNLEVKAVQVVGTFQGELSAEYAVRLDHLHTWRLQ